MRKLLIATAAAAGLLALGACQPAATDDEANMADAAEEGATEASADGAEGSGGSTSGDASAAGDSGSDASADGASGDYASPPESLPPASGTTDPMVTGQGSDGAEGRIQMPSEPSHPARQ